MADAPRTPMNPRTRVLLGAVYLVVTGAVFVLGIWVGRDLASRHPPEPDRVVAMAAPERPEPGQVPRPVDEKFFDTFRQERYNSLEGEAESPSEEEGTAAPEIPVAATATREAVATEPARTTTRIAATPTRRREATRAPTQPPRATATPRLTPTARPTRAAGRGSWVIQVGSTRSGAEAFDWSMQLRGKGFVPHTDESPRGATTWYRVRLGPFATREEAVQEYQRLTGSTKFKDAYITTQ